jgi:hypothetical protein
VTDSPDESVDQALTVDPSQEPFPKNLFVVLLGLAVVLPPVGMLMGAFNMDKPKRRKQSQLLLGIGLVSIVVIIMFRS